MNYALIRENDIANGPGVRTSLFVSGCRHHCKGCFNPETWNFNYGNPFTQKETYWVLDYCPNKLDYNLEIDFLMMSSEVRVYYPNNKVIESFMLKGAYPVNITNGFNLVNVFTNIIETSANTDNYLTSFVIDRTTGKNVSAGGDRRGG